MSRKRKRRTDPDICKEQLLAVAIELAKRVGYRNVTRPLLAHKSKVSVSLISTRFGSVPELYDDIMRAAVDREILPIIAQGIVAKDSIALNASDALKKRAMQHPI